MQSPTQAYDDHAQSWAKVMEGINLASTHLELPAMEALLPDLQGRSVLCLGCGTGNECAEMLRRGARKVMGADMSPRLIHRARMLHPQIPFVLMDIAKLGLAAESFDLVYCSKAMHYVQDWTQTLQALHRALRPEGKMLLSTHHPGLWGGQINRTPDSLTKLFGYRYSDGFSNLEIFGDYFDNSMRTDMWRGGIPVHYYHKKLSSMFNEISAAGFRIIEIIEPQPIPAAKLLNENFYSLFTKVPLFLILVLEKSTH